MDEDSGQPIQLVELDQKNQSDDCLFAGLVARLRSRDSIKEVKYVKGGPKIGSDGVAVAVSIIKISFMNIFF